MQLKKWWAGVIVIAVVVGAIQAATLKPSVVMGQAGGDGSDAPYLYYFSGDLNAWVIERADGSDRRLLGQGLMPEETNNATGYGWSPSGKWFAWTSFNVIRSYPYTNSKYEAVRRWLVNIEDGTQISIDRAGVWSPTEDLLLVEEAKDYQFFRKLFPRGLRSRLRYVRYVVVDTDDNSRKLVFEREIKGWYSLSDVRWLEDGQSLLFTFWHYVDSQANITIILCDKHGNLRQYTTVADSFNVLPNGVVAHLHNRTLIVTDLVHQQSRTIRLDIPDNLHIAGVNWNKAGDGVFITAQESGSIGKSIWWLDLNTPQVHFVGYLVSRYRQAYHGLTYQAVSPTGRYFAYLDESNRVNYFDSATGKLARLGIKLDQYNVFGDPQFYWTSNDYLIIFSANKMLYDADKNRRVVLVNAATGNVKVLSLGIDLLMPPQLSADERHLAWVNDGPTILDIQAGNITTLGADSRAIGSSRGGFVRWHPTANWFLAYDDGMQAGGGRGPYFVSVVSADGQVRRELYPDSVINWLPENVNPNLLQ